jgi:hypothetical protein
MVVGRARKAFRANDGAKLYRLKAPDRISQQIIKSQPSGWRIESFLFVGTIVVHPKEVVTFKITTEKKGLPENQEQRPKPSKKDPPVKPWQQLESKHKQKGIKDPFDLEALPQESPAVVADSLTVFVLFSGGIVALALLYVSHRRRWRRKISALFVASPEQEMKTK